MNLNLKVPDTVWKGMEIEEFDENHIKLHDMTTGLVIIIRPDYDQIREESYLRMEAELGNAYG